MQASETKTFNQSAKEMIKGHAWHSTGDLLSYANPKNPISKLCPNCEKKYSARRLVCKSTHNNLMEKLSFDDQSKNKSQDQTARYDNCSLHLKNKCINDPKIEPLDANKNQAAPVTNSSTDTSPVPEEDSTEPVTLEASQLIPVMHNQSSGGIQDQISGDAEIQMTSRRNMAAQDPFAKQCSGSKSDLQRRYPNTLFSKLKIAGSMLCSNSQTKDTDKGKEYKIGAWSYFLNQIGDGIVDGVKMNAITLLSVAAVAAVPHIGITILVCTALVGTIIAVAAFIHSANKKDNAEWQARKLAADTTKTTDEKNEVKMKQRKKYGRQIVKSGWMDFAQNCVLGAVIAGVVAGAAATGAGVGLLIAGVLVYTAIQAANKFYENSAWAGLKFNLNESAKLKNGPDKPENNVKDPDSFDPQVDIKNTISAVEMAGKALSWGLTSFGTYFAVLALIGVFPPAGAGVLIISLVAGAALMVAPKLYLGLRNMTQK
ncbi:MAG: hypothetical protein GY874_23150 [Desulfobacteraceae bacterium]|nr:hypothetical protein [Desulfobacteraceae bacterium]